MKAKISMMLAVLLMCILFIPAVAFAEVNASDELTYMAPGVPGYQAVVGSGKVQVTTLKLQNAGGVESSAYCLDANVQIVANHKYSVANLENSTYFTTAKAEKIRKILLNSYPYKTRAEIETISGKSIYNDEEAITATQLALWEVANDQRYDPYVWPDYGYMERTKLLRDWYLTLSGQAAASPVSDVEVTSTQVGQNVDIAYRATQTNADGSLLDLTCTVDSGLQTQVGVRDGQGYQHLIVTNAPTSMTATFSGSQIVAEDAYLYQPKGGKTAAQTMCGVSKNAVAISLKKVIQSEVPVVKTGGITIKKIDSATNLPIAGVKFMLSANQDFTGVVYDLVTNNLGLATKDGLAAGTWYIREVKAPASYMPLTADITKTVADAVVEVEVKNTPYSGIRIVKVNETGEKLSGAIFDIYAGSAVTGTPVVNDAVSDEYGIIMAKDLPAGTYTIVEVQAPNGYELDSMPRTVNLLLGEAHEIIFRNTRQVITVAPILHILKYDADTKLQLGGAKFKIYSDEALQTQVADVTSLADAPVVIDTLSAGIYYIQEYEVPSGYLLDPTVQKVTLADNQTTVAKFYNSKTIPTAGNYSALLLSGLVMLVFCGLGWGGLVAYRKKH